MIKSMIKYSIKDVLMFDARQLESLFEPNWNLSNLVVDSSVKLSK